MATIGSSNLTLLDRIKRTDPDGKIANVVELLANSNEILTDAVHREANGPTSHRTTIRTGLPTVYTRALNQYVPSSKSTTAQIDEGMAIFEAFSQVDKDLVELEGDAASFRLSEDMPFIEAMNQAQAACTFYGNSTLVPTEYMGLSARYSATSGGNGQNILLGGGSQSDNTSIWLVVWGDNTVFCPYPKGSKVGLVQDDLGLKESETTAGLMRVYRSNYQWKTGMVVRDWRYAVRIANIDVGDLVGMTGTQAHTAATAIVKLMARAIARVPNLKMGKPAFYMNGTVFEGLQLMAMEKTANVLRIQEGLDQFGRSSAWTSFMGVPLRRVDALMNTEAVVA